MEKKQICLTHKHQCVGKTLSCLAPITGMLLIASCQVGRSVGGDFSLRRVTGQRMNSQGPQHCPHWALWVGATTKTSTPPQPKSHSTPSTQIPTAPPQPKSPQHHPPHAPPAGRNVNEDHSHQTSACSRPPETIPKSPKRNFHQWPHAYAHPPMARRP